MAGTWELSSAECLLIRDEVVTFRNSKNSKFIVTNCTFLFTWCSGVSSLHDNVPVNIPSSIKTLLGKVGMEELEGPAQSSDLNATGHLLDKLKF